jgi:hypothetical protein
VTHEEVAARVGEPHYAEALKLADEAKKADQMATYIDRYRQIVNFEYWRLRSKVEQTPEAIAARKAIFQADTFNHNAQLLEAREAYLKGFRGWRKVLDKFPALLDDQTTGEDLVEVINRYRKLVESMDPNPEEAFSKGFPLQDVLNKYGKKHP